MNELCGGRSGRGGGAARAVAAQGGASAQGRRAVPISRVSSRFDDGQQGAPTPTTSPPPSEVPRGHRARTPSSTTPTGAWRRSSTATRSTSRRSSCCAARPTRPTSTCASSSASTSTRPRTRRRPRRCKLLEDVVDQAARLVRGAAAARAAPASRASRKKAADGLRGLPEVSAAVGGELDPQIHMLLGTALRLRQGLGRGAARVRGAAQDQAQRHDRQADARRGARRQGRLQPGHLALRAHPRRGAEAAEHLLQPRQLLPAREALRRRAARGRALHQGQADTTPRATCSSCDALYEQKNYPARARRVSDGGAAGSGQRRHQGQDRPHLPRHEELPVGASPYLEQAVAGAKARRRQGSRDARRARRGLLGGATRRRTSSTRSPTTWRRSARIRKAQATAGQVYFLAGNDERATATLQRVAGDRAEQRGRARRRWSRCSTGAPAPPSRRTRSARPTASCSRGGEADARRSR